MTADPTALEILDITEVIARVDAAGPRTWLVERLWPGDAYGVLGAEDKAGKTWSILDLACSVAAGQPWFGRFACPAGAVVLFLGEGGEAAMLRRLRAVCEHKDVKLDDLPLRLCFAVPRLGSGEHLGLMAAELAAHPARMVGLDPFYLAAAGASGASLNEMGVLLSAAQGVCQVAGSALVVNVHWNKRGTGTGPQRFTGVGPSAWGRVLGSAAVEQAHIEPDSTTTNVVLAFEFKGGEIPDAAFRVRRRVWADDPDDLDSALHYQAEVTSEGPPAGAGESRPPSYRRVMAALKGAGGSLTVQQIGDLLARDGQGMPLKKRTIQRALDQLEADGLAQGTEPLPGFPGYWSVVNP